MRLGGLHQADMLASAASAELAEEARAVRQEAAVVLGAGRVVGAEAWDETSKFALSRLIPIKQACFVNMSLRKSV